LLLEHGMRDVVDGLRELGEKGQLEFVGSGKFHPILPLIPESERKRAIAENATTNSAAYGDAWKPRGFFPPEMCYGPEIAAPIHETGHEWVILSGVACPAEWPIDRVYRAPANSGTVAVLFRDDIHSNRISFRETSPEKFVDELSRLGGPREAYMLTAMDAETYGHHLRNWEEEFLGATVALVAQHSKRGTSKVRMVLPSELLTLFPAGPVIEPHPSSWSTSVDDLAAHNPYPLWKAPGNAFHDMQWEYVDHCMDLVAVARRYATNEDSGKFAAIAYERLGPALHSCQFWWASQRPMWDVSMIHRGFLLLNQVAFNAAKAITAGSASEPVKKQAQWRLAAANEIRLRMEHELIGSSGG
jgi:alpha-amylase/alpha-mannosidase (GH57 family)